MSLVVNVNVIVVVIVIVIVVVVGCFVCVLWGDTSGGGGVTARRPCS